MNALAFTAITDFVLAAETLFLAGRMSSRAKVRFSAIWYLCCVLILLGIGALLGGIDHGFVEPAGLPRFGIQRADWIVLAGVTFCLLLATAGQFFPPRLRRIAPAIAGIQFAVATAAALLAGSFLAVIVNYVPVLLLLLVLNIAAAKRGGGSGWITAGILILFAGSGLQAAGIDLTTVIDRNGLFHLASMIGVYCLYRGGLGFRTE